MYLLAVSLLTVTAVAGFGPAARGGFVIDTFNYPNGSLNGKSGGGGFSTAWTAAGSGQTVNGGQLRITGNNDNMAYRTLASAQSGTVYFSFNFRFTGAASDATNDFFALWFDNVTTGGHTGVPNVGLKGDGFFARLSLGGETYGPNLVAGQDYFLVGKLEKTVSGGTYNKVTLWVDPTDESSSSISKTGSSSSGIASFDKIGIRTANLNPTGDSVDFDNFQMGYSFDSVEELPAPPALVLAALGIPALGLARRLTRKAPADAVVA